MSKYTLIGMLPRLLALGIVLQPTVSAAGPATIFSASFETVEPQNWTVLRNDIWVVDTTHPVAAESNFDGVAGNRFMLFGMGMGRGKIRFEFPTVVGKTYNLSYSHAATDTERGSEPPAFQVSFVSSVVAYFGKKKVLNHVGQEVEVDDTEVLEAEVHQSPVPGIRSWKIHSWNSASYSFVAKSGVTRVEFDTNQATGWASVGVLDDVRITTEPFAQVSPAPEGAKLEYAGKLQESTDLIRWTDVDPQPASPFLVQQEAGSRFFRVEK